MVRTNVSKIDLFSRRRENTGDYFPSLPIDFFPPAIVNSQIAQVDRPKILERMVFGSSPLLSVVFVTFSFQIEDLEKFQVFSR